MLLVVERGDARRWRRFTGCNGEPAGRDCDDTRIRRRPQDAGCLHRCMNPFLYDNISEASAAARGLAATPPELAHRFCTRLSSGRGRSGAPQFQRRCPAKLFVRTVSSIAGSRLRRPSRRETSRVYRPQRDPRQRLRAGRNVPCSRRGNRPRRRSTPSLAFSFPTSNAVCPGNPDGFAVRLHRDHT